MRSTSRSPGTPMTSGVRLPSGCAHHEHHVLQGVRRPVHGRSGTRERARWPRRPGWRSWGCPGCPRRARPAPRRRTAAVGAGMRDRLDVGRVTAGRADEGVLAGVGDGQELLARRAAHRPRHGLDDHVLEAEPVEDLDVGVAVRVVGRLQAGVVDVEGVGVLHHELAAAQDAGPGPGFVAVLGLDLVQRQRQVLVGGVQVLHQQGEHLLVGRPEQVVGALAVLEPEEVGRRTRSSGPSPRRARAAAAPGTAPPGRRSRPSPRGRSAPPWAAPASPAAASCRCPARPDGCSRRAPASGGWRPRRPPGPRAASGRTASTGG